MGVTNRNRKLYMELLHGLEDLGSKIFREHWYYRAMMFRINTNASMNLQAREMYDKLMEAAKDYRGEHEL